MSRDKFRLTLGGEIRANRGADGKPSTIVGKIKYDVRSQPIYGMFYEIVKPGAFARAIKGEDDVRALVNHDSSMVIGRSTSKTLRLIDEADGLRYEVDLPDTTFARDLLTSIERGDISQTSFGFRKIKDQWSEERTKDGITVDIRELIEVELLDVSPVAYPAYTENTIAARCLEEARAQRSTPRLRAARLRLAEAGV